MTEQQKCSAGSARLSAIASRIAEIEPSWLPIAGHVRNVTLTLDEADLVILALTRPATAAQPKQETDWFDECSKQAGKAFHYWTALERIAIVCTQNMDRDKNHRMALDGVRQIANDYLDASQPSPAATVEVSKEIPADMRPIVSALKGRFFECGGHMREMSENEAFDIALALRRAREDHEWCSAGTADVRQKAENAIRTFCQSLGTGSVSISSDGVERIYYAGINLKALSVAVAMAVSRPELRSGK